jgi:hypothetical protein
VSASSLNIHLNTHPDESAHDIIHDANSPASFVCLGKLQTELTPVHDVERRGQQPVWDQL